MKHCAIGFQLLSLLINEMFKCYETMTNRCIGRQRKAAISFRDELLNDIFELCTTSVKLTLGNLPTFNFEDGKTVKCNL